jgi:demethylmenaquinone methyltransferase/2-methoxy-6-polyprenyl-1,4-benzoquinol methylase
MDQPGQEALEIRRMFSAIAPRYDLLNRLLSIGRDAAWRRVAVGSLPAPARGRPLAVLDVACGTADVALEVLRQSPGAWVAGVDFALPMLQEARRKLRASGFNGSCALAGADAMRLPFRDGLFDAALIAFGIRNVVDRQSGLTEMARLVRPGGRVIVLEFSRPAWRPLRWLYEVYFTKLLPRIGQRMSGHPTAYRYLPTSVLAYPTPEGFSSLMAEAGLEGVGYRRLTGGIVTLHVGTVPVGNGTGE